MAFNPRSFRKDKNKVINVRILFGVNRIRKSIVRKNRVKKDIFFFSKGRNHE